MSDLIVRTLLLYRVQMQSAKSLGEVLSPPASVY